MAEGKLWTPDQPMPSVQQAHEVGTLMGKRLYEANGKFYVNDADGGRLVEVTEQVAAVPEANWRSSASRSVAPAVTTGYTTHEPPDIANQVRVKMEELVRQKMLATPVFHGNTEPDPAKGQKWAWKFGGMSLSKATIRSMLVVFGIVVPRVPDSWHVILHPQTVKDMESGIRFSQLYSAKSFMKRRVVPSWYYAGFPIVMDWNIGVEQVGFALVMHSFAQEEPEVAHVNLVGDPDYVYQAAVGKSRKDFFDHALQNERPLTDSEIGLLSSNFGPMVNSQEAEELLTKAPHISDHLVPCIQEAMRSSPRVRIEDALGPVREQIVIQPKEKAAYPPITMKAARVLTEKFGEREGGWEEVADALRDANLLKPVAMKRKA